MFLPLYNLFEPLDSQLRIAAGRGPVYARRTGYETAPIFVDDARRARSGEWMRAP
jgi:hypothetical protein